MWFRADIVGRNFTLVTLRFKGWEERVKWIYLEIAYGNRVTWSSLLDYSFNTKWKEKSMKTKLGCLYPESSQSLLIQKKNNNNNNNNKKKTLNMTERSAAKDKGAQISMHNP